MSRTILSLIAVFLLGTTAFDVQAASTPTGKCRALRMLAAGKYAACQNKALSLFPKGKTFQHLQTASSKCSDKLTGSWSKLQSKFAGSGTVCEGPRFELVGNIVVDHLTGLFWERKTSLDGSPNLSDPQDVDNEYTWSTFTDANGTAFTGFLESLNDDPCYNGTCDWRLPTRIELHSILSESHPDGVACTSTPCIDPVFGSTVVGDYWTGTTDSGSTDAAWYFSFLNGNQSVHTKTSSNHARAVVGGW